MKEIIIDFLVEEKSRIIELPISSNGIIEMDFTDLDDDLDVESQNPELDNGTDFLNDTDEDSSEFDDTMTDDLDI